MNEKDKKAFWDWLHNQHHAVTLETVWQAACEHKQGEIDELVAVLRCTLDWLEWLYHPSNDPKGMHGQVTKRARETISKHEANQ